MTTIALKNEQPNRSRMQFSVTPSVTGPLLTSLVFKKHFQRHERSFLTTFGGRENKKSKVDIMEEFKETEPVTSTPLPEGTPGMSYCTDAIAQKSLKATSED